jgi:hypothetical protein
MPPKTANAGGAFPEIVFREFQGMNLIAEREAINDNEFYWCENAIPVAAAALYPQDAPFATTLYLPETSVPSYVMAFNVNGQNYQFVVFEQSGNGYVVLLATVPTFSKIFTGTLTSGQTYATQYNNLGLLIIDPDGYWDWNITTANTVTPQNNTAALVSLVNSVNVAGGIALKQIVTATGTGATFQTIYQVVSATLITGGGGFGYAVGDSITLTDGNPTTPAQIIVASISGGGTTGPVTGITLADGGSYPGPTSATLIATGPSGTVTSTTGTGSGASFTTHIQATTTNVLTRGAGYTGTGTLDNETVIGTVIDSWTITSSGVIGGTGIATYQGRVWLSSNRTVYFTDIDSYNSFGGVGGSFTINDAYLHDGITVLYAANNYLYIFGDTSIDALSNVTVNLGVTSFSRINVTTTVGTTQPTSVFGYYRALVFFNSSGVYLLAGATPERISEKITPIITGFAPGANQNVFGFSVQVQGEICAAMQLAITDNWTQGGTIRPLVILYFRNRWWVSSFILDANPAFPTTAVTSVPVSQGVITAYGWRVQSAGVRMYTLFPPPSFPGLAGSGLSTWLVKSKLWDGGAPVVEKQSLNVALGATYNASAAQDVTVSVDTEYATDSAVASPWPAQNPGYDFEVSAANLGGSQYLGMTVTGTTAIGKIRMLALRGTADRPIMQ